jgi:co-chaperonin GroES (HSP10)
MIDVSPLYDLIMVQVTDKPRVSRSGLILAKEVQPELEEGLVVAFGQDVSRETKDRIQESLFGVMFAAEDHESNSYYHDGKKFLFIEEHKIFAAAIFGNGDKMPRIQAPLGKWSLMEWEEAHESLLGGLLVRPVLGSKAHFTGKALMCGHTAYDMEPGKRYFFEQFSDFKSWAENGKRYAFVPYSAIYCEIPEREADVCLAPSEVANNLESVLR